MRTLGIITEPDYAPSLGACVDSAVDAARCEDAVAVESTFDDCVEGISTMQCSAWNVPASELGTVTPPPACNRVILVR